MMPANPTEEAVLAAQGVRKGFRAGEQDLVVLDGLDLAVQPGELLGICGASGSGKTTFLNILAGLEAPDAGTVAWGGATLPAKGLSRLAQRRGDFLGMVFQHYYLVPELNALENVTLAGRLTGKRRESLARARELLEAVGLAERLKSLPHQLSGGERQRVAIARALMNAPPVILADEPTGNLDERSADGVLKLFLQLCRERATALVLVTHSRALAARCDRVQWLRGGQLHAEA